MNYPKLLLSCQTLKQEQLSPVSIPEVAPAVGDLLTGAQRITQGGVCYRWQWQGLVD